jgi:putative SOS response-associated peptidase YedK
MPPPSAGSYELMAPIHDPCRSLSDLRIGKSGGEEPANDNEPKAMLKPFPSERMSAWPVGKAVGNVKNDGPDLIERAAVRDS